ncbi:GMP synthase [Actinidia chinensis var. chinensis]|uniref:GMP synthase n=1 Tax=Actinidia chinensis var. chinensis TaxID=1590841 RepID=A0A2R6P403_ACTCC|nr:GMP synthase [Actinidia chinensis var. chinensis]
MKKSSFTNQSFINFQSIFTSTQLRQRTFLLPYSILNMLSKENAKRHVLEKNKSSPREKEKPNHGFLSKHLKKVYPISLRKSCSPLSLSSLSLTLSQNSNDSSLTDSSIVPLDREISLALQRIVPPERRDVSMVAKNVQQSCQDHPSSEGLKRCNWITKNSDKTYVQFHDDCWGVPVYDDNQLFELLALSGMLMDYNWTEILKRKELFREAFAGFDPNTVAKMGEKEIMEIASNKAIMLAESRVRCIVDNAKCIVQIVKEFGSFSSYAWAYVDYKPVINRYRYPRNVPLRTPKAEAISRDLVKCGFRFVGPVIVYSFMQAAGMTIDHLVDCFRFSECVSIAERPWRHI